MGVCLPSSLLERCGLATATVTVMEAEYGEGGAGWCLHSDFQVPPKPQEFPISSPTPSSSSCASVLTKARGIAKRLQGQGDQPLSES